MNLWTLVALVGCLTHAASLLVLVARVGAGSKGASHGNRHEAGRGPVVTRGMVYGDPAEGEWEHAN